MAKRKQIIKVWLGGPVRASGAEFTYRPPLVSVHIASDETWSIESGVLPSHSTKRYSALIDTGADYCALDPSVSEEIGARSAGSGLMHNWVGTDEKVVFVQIQIVIRPSVGFDAQAALKDFRSQGQPWDVVLGRDFLRYCRLYVDGRAARYHLHWMGA